MFGSVIAGVSLATAVLRCQERSTREAAGLGVYIWGSLRRQIGVKKEFGVRAGEAV